MKVIVLLLLTSFAAAARCPDPSWVVDDDRIDGIVSKEGQPLKHAKVRLVSRTQQYSAITDETGRFLIRDVPVGKYSFAVTGWGEAHLEVRGWHRGGINRPVLLLNSRKACLWLMEVSN